MQVETHYFSRPPVHYRLPFSILAVLLLFINSVASGQTVEPQPENYFADQLIELKKEWPKNRTLRFVFHGHSVPAGYFKTPTIQRFDSYPILFQQELCKAFPTAAIDVCVTAIGGENSQRGAERFERDVLNLKPDVVFIDYCLNDRGMGLPAAREAWGRMIEQCIAAGVKVVLLTATPDVGTDILDDTTPLAQHSQQVKDLAAEYGLPVVDSYAEFRSRVVAGTPVGDLLSQSNHPNRAGHELVSRQIVRLFAGAE